MNHMANRVPVDQLSRFNPAEKNKVRFGFVFDTCIYAAAGHDTLSLFVSPEGSQINDNSRIKSAEDTNLGTSGTLPSNQAMLVKGVEILYLPGLGMARSEADAASTSATQKYFTNDIAAFYNAGLLHLGLKGVDIIKDGPLSVFPPQTGLDGSPAMTNTDTDNNKFVEIARCVGKPYPLEWFVWKGGEVISAKMLWPNGKVAMPSGVAGRVKIRLHGDIYEVK